MPDERRDSQPPPNERPPKVQPTVVVRFGPPPDDQISPEMYERIMPKMMRKEAKR